MQANEAVCIERNGRLDSAGGGYITGLLGAARTRTRSLCGRNQDAHHVSPTEFLLEVGPGITLSTLAPQTARGMADRAFGSLPEAGAQSTDEETMLAALGKLWVSGITPDWAAVADGPRSRVSLPTYPFERRRHWIDPPARGPVSPAPAFSSSPAIASVYTETAAVAPVGSGQT